MSERYFIKDEFGFLPYKLSFEFNDIRIWPVEDFDDKAKVVMSWKHPNGDIYPPIEKKIKRQQEIPNSEREAQLYKMPSSHYIEYRSEKITSKEELRKKDFWFIIHLLAYIFGSRLQFHDWWFYRKIPKDHSGFVISPIHAEHFLSSSYLTWTGLPSDLQQRFNSILYTHSLTPSYEWDWERFTFEYMVFDACWKFATIKYGLNNRTPHKDRIIFLCEYFDIPYDQKIIDVIVDLRNDIIHEFIWDKGFPCSAGGSFSIHQAHNLNKLIQRLIPRFLNYENKFSHTQWTFFDKFSFESPVT